MNFVSHCEGSSPSTAFSQDDTCGTSLNNYSEEAAAGFQSCARSHSYTSPAHAHVHKDARKAIIRHCLCLD